MQEQYDDEMLQQINENADLIEYVSQTMDLTEKSGRLWAHCPAHIDRTPSLCFNPELNTYHCFSCGKSGGMIGYLIDYEGLRFDDAVKKAAGIADMDMSSMCRSQTVIYLKKLRDVFKPKKQPEKHKVLQNSELMKYMQEPATEWIEEGIDEEVMNEFGIRIDKRSNRIVYPVYDIQGNLINIKGRTRYTNYKKLGINKYQNYYAVGTMDYIQGLNITLPHVLKKREIIIFESLKSVMKAYGWGFKNCASAEKHTLTREQIDLLIGLRCDIVFAYDNDVSYLEADVKKNIDMLKRITNVYIIEDTENLLGGALTKNAPVDCGEEVWRELYANKRKVV